MKDKSDGNLLTKAPIHISPWHFAVKRTAAILGVSSTTMFQPDGFLSFYPRTNPSFFLPHFLKYAQRRVRGHNNFMIPFKVKPRVL